MADIAADVLPIFILIAIGWSVVTWGLLKPEVGDALGDFVFKVAVPVLLCRNIATADIGAAAPWRLWIVYFAGVVIAWGLGDLIARRVFGRDPKIAVVAGVSAAFANNVFIGLPLVDRLLGHDGVVAVSILLSVHLPVMMIAGTLMMQRAERAMTGSGGRPIGDVFAEVGHNLVRNPLVIGLAAGLVINLFGIPLAGVAGTIVDQIAGIAGPAALLAMGMAMRRYGIAGEIRPAIAMGLLKLFLLPAAVYGASLAVGLEPAFAAALVLTSSVPTGVNAYLIANHFGEGRSLASSTITLTTAVGALTVTFWAFVLGVGG